MKNYSLKSKIDGIGAKEPRLDSHLAEAYRIQIDFLKPAKNNSRKSLRLFVGGAILILLLTLVPQSVNQSMHRSKRILGVATTGFDSLQSGQFETAAKSFEDARTQLQDSKDTLVQALNFLPVGGDLEAALQVGTHVTTAVNLLLSGIAEFQNTRLNWDAASNSSSQEFYQSLKKSHGFLVNGNQELVKARDLIDTIDQAILPQSYKEKFQKAKEQLEDAGAVASQLENLQGLLLQILGGEKKTYILVFQNNNEMRATGGFMGTYGILQFENGSMRIDRIESIYALDGQLHEAIAAPGPLRRQSTQTWALRDSNWFVDFPTSAGKILEFLEKEGEILADGVIAMTPDVFEGLLAVAGPVEMLEYGETLTAENFREVVQYKTSLDYDQAVNQPKKFLADFAPRFLSRLKDLDTSEWLTVASILNDEVSRKNLMVFSINSDIQKQIVSFRADGGIKTTAQDYLAIFHSNVGGGKTDQGIKQAIEKKVSIDSSGLAIVRLRITRSHNAHGEKFFPKNVDFMRILVPRSASLLSVSGFDNYELLPSQIPGASTDSALSLWDQAVEYDPVTSMYIGEESGYKFFANWQELMPGETKSVELTYEIQFASPKAYTQLFQKQPGSTPSDFLLEINYLPGNISYYYPQAFTKQGNILSLSEQVNTDRFYGVIGQ